MNDLEICKKIAKIERISYSVGLSKKSYPARSIIFHQERNDPREKIKEYNPLTDDGLCFRLMLKHNIRLSKNSDGNYVAMYTHCRGEDDISPNKAICLAIIEKQEGTDYDEGSRPSQ